MFVGTYPPRECGIATFNQDLLNSSRKFLEGVSCKVAAFNLSPLDNYKYPPEVRWKIDQNSKKEHLELARKINNSSLISGVVLQHEYGIYGGEEGENILSFLRFCKKPKVVTLHTVLPNPSPKMLDVTNKIILFSNSIVVLTQNSKKLLAELYPSSIGKVHVIPHGIHYTGFSSTKNAKLKLKLQGHTILSTFGLLSRGKGIEYVINSLPTIIKKYPKVLYLILGETHPVIRRNEGEKYRLELSKLVNKLSLKKHVKFYDQYLTLTDLLEFLKATDIYISTSINPNQAVSGTLSYALGTGRAVVSTEFAQSKEIVSQDAGRLVPIKSHSAMAAALDDLLSDENRLTQMHKSAYELTRPMLWSNVASLYSKLLKYSILPPLNLNHLKNMTDEFGLFQFASLSRPHKKFGYTLDDNARAIVICNQLVRQKGYIPEDIGGLIGIYLNFIKKCQNEDGTFVNYIKYNTRTPTNQNNQEDLEDAASRGMWAIAELFNNPLIPKNYREIAKEIFLRSLPHITKFSHLRARAFIIKALALMQIGLPEYQQELQKLIKQNADQLIAAIQKNSHKSWYWFENYLGYNNAILSESLIIAYNILKNEDYLVKGELTLNFLIEKTFSTNIYMPIGHSHWYKKDQKRSHFDQQPEDPSSMVIALVTAYKITQNESYRNLAAKCFSWFLGNNSLQIPLYNNETGACFDGLHPDRVNLNQGAESLVSYLLARIALEELKLNENLPDKKYFS